MNKEKLISCIQLINTPGVGPVNFKRMLNRYGSVENALSGISAKMELFPRKSAEEEVMIAEIKKTRIITYEDEEYPYNLKQIEDNPPLLYARGDINLLKNDNALAVVGARNATLGALKIAQKISSEIAAAGITIVSGLARGIDAAAHIGALSSGKTIAVLGTGIDVVYPKENEALFEKIAKNGLIITEYPFHTRPQAPNFPRRNRIVSGLSKAVLVIEAGLRSGSLITAHTALEQGRDVFAIPGAPYDDRASGCNQLLKEGAGLVDCAEDILDNFNFTPQNFILHKNKNSETADLFEYSLDNAKNNLDIPEYNNKCSVRDISDDEKEPDEKAKLLSLISSVGEDVDELIRISQIPAQTALRLLMELELEGKIIRVPGNKVAKA